MNLNSYGQVTNARWIPLKAIRPSPFQARVDMGEQEMAELVKSIQTRGVETPIKIRPKGRDLFEIVFGHRRHEAARRAGLKEIPALIEEMDDETAALAGLAENLDRKDFTDWEASQGIVNLAKLSAEQGGEELSEAELARRLNRSRTYIRNAYEVVGLTGPLAEVAKKTSGAKSALLLIAKEVDADDQRLFAEVIQNERPSFKDVQRRVESYKAEKEMKGRSHRPDNPTRKAMARATSQQTEARQMVHKLLPAAEQATREVSPWIDNLSPDDHAKYAQRLETIKRRVEKW